jgi:hypothetical protein
MLEPIIAISVIFVLWIVAIIANAFLEDSGMWQYFVYALLATGVLYCLVRFIHWAWETPMPFLR